MNKIAVILILLIFAAISGCTGMGTMRSGMYQPANAEIESNVTKFNGKYAKDNVIYLPVISRTW